MPSGPNRGPGAIRTPTVGASRASSEANGPGSATHRLAPPDGRLTCQSGKSAAIAEVSTAAPSASRRRCTSKARPGSVEEVGGDQLVDHRPGHVTQALAAANRLISVGAARIQPMRSPPQTDFDSEPSESTRRPVGSSADIRGGSGGDPGNGTSRNDSSISSSVPLRCAVPHDAARGSSGPSARRSGSGSPGSGRPGAGRSAASPCPSSRRPTPVRAGRIALGGRRSGPGRPIGPGMRRPTGSRPAQPGRSGIRSSPGRPGLRVPAAQGRRRAVRRW